MTKQEAIKILEHHNAWRRGAEIKMLDQKLIGKAIDVAIKEMKK